MEDLIKQFFDSQAILSDEEWATYKSKIIKRNFKRNELILKEGDVENYLSFITKGFVRAFTTNKNGDEITTDIISFGFMSSYDSFTSRKPSLISIQVLEDVELLCVTNESLNELYKISHTGEKLGRINAELLSSYTFSKYIELITTTAEERYLKLLNDNPNLLNKAKQIHISTFLGIKPESLSRIKKNIALKKS